MKKIKIDSSIPFINQFSQYFESFIQYEHWTMIDDHFNGTHQIWVDVNANANKVHDKIFANEIVNNIKAALEDKVSDEPIQLILRQGDSSTRLIAALFKSLPDDSQLYLVKKHLFADLNNNIYMLDYLNNHKNKNTLDYAKAIISAPVKYEEKHFRTEYDKDSHSERLIRALSFLRSSHQFDYAQTLQMENAFVSHLQYSENITLMDNDVLMQMIKAINPQAHESYIQQCFSIVHPHIQFSDDLMEDIDYPVSQFKISHNKFIATTHFQTIEASKGFFEMLENQLKPFYEKMGLSSLKIIINTQAKGNPEEDDYTVIMVSNSPENVNRSIIKKVIQSVIDYEQENVNFMRDILAQDVCYKVLNDVVMFHTLNNKIQDEVNARNPEDTKSSSFKI
jgi:hypothetical protein